MTLQKIADLATNFSVAKIDFSVAKWLSDGIEFSVVILLVAKL